MRMNMPKSMLCPSQIVEVVGPPGSGKTTLVNLLQKNHRDMEITIFPYFRQISTIPFFVKSLLLLSPTLLDLYRNREGQNISRRDVAVMAILHKWNEILVRRAAIYERTIVLEEGAVCLLAKLSASSSECLQGRTADAWWKTTYRKWAETIDVIIQLDTPVPALLKRIRSRELQFEIEAMSDQDATAYLMQIQTAQANVLSRLMAERKAPRLFCVSTVEKSPEQIYAEVTRSLSSND